MKFLSLKELFKNHKMFKIKFYWTLFGGFWIGLIIVSFLVVYFENNLGIDASDYLGYSRLILKGKHPIIDYPVAYPPLPFYLVAVLMKLFGDSVCTIRLIQLGIMLLDAYLLYKICVNSNLNKLLSFYGVFLFMCLVLLLDGTDYLLEPIVLIFGLLSLYFVIQKKLSSLFLSGLMCFFSLCSKQYGIGFFFLVNIYVILSCRNKIQLANEILSVFAGFLCGLALFLIVYYYCGVLPSVVISQLSGEGYEFKGFDSMLQSMTNIVFIFPVCIFVLVYMVYHIKYIIGQPILFVSLFGILGFSLQSFVRPYPHYLQLMVPFLVLITIWSVDQTYKLGKLRHAIAYIILIAFSPMYSLLKLNYTEIKYKDRSAIEQYAKRVEDFVPKGTENVYMIRKMILLQYLNEYWPPLIEEYGLLGGMVYKKEDKLKLLENANYCIMKDSAWVNEWDCSPEMLCYLEENFKKNEIKFDNNGTIFVYIRKNRRKL